MPRRPTATPEVIVRWRKLPGSDLEVAQVARDVAETILGHIQRRFDAPVLLAGTTGITATNQAAEPIGYVEARERFAGLQWVDANGQRARVMNDSGGWVMRETPMRVRRARRLAPVTWEKPVPVKRASIVYIRPGRGGRQQRSVEDTLDPTSGLEKYGEAVWWSVSGGAMLGVITLNPDGNGIGWCRLSGDDGDETLDGQMTPITSLVNRKDELNLRYALLAVDMAGWREVRFDDGRVIEQGLAVRDDVLQIHRWIKEGWLEHVVLRDQRRLARDTIPGDQIIRFLDSQNIGLWFTDIGRQIDYVTDRAMLRFFNVIAAEDLDNTNRQLQMARVNKGPLAGKGWGAMPFGFYRDRRGRPCQDSEQWPFILRAFELADALGSDRPGDFSIRKVRLLVEQEGCKFSDAKMGVILTSRIYATGEYAVNVRGIRVAQDAIPLENPVPLDRFLRVQEMAALRQGKSSTTDIGECLVNYVEGLHERCMDENVNRPMPVRVKGYRNKKSDLITYRHYPGPLPACCRHGGRNLVGGFSWPRDLIDPRVVEKLRELASHPEVLRQAALAARHTNAHTTTRLSAEQRAQLEREQQILADQVDRLAEEWVEGLSQRSNKIDLAGFGKLSSTVQRKLDAITARLDNDRLMADAAESDAGNPDSDRVRAFLEIMTVETPTDPFHKQLRARLFQRIVSRVLIDDDGEGPITLTIEGHLVPETAPLEMANPVLRCADLIDAYEARKRGELPVAEARLVVEDGLRTEIESVSGEGFSETVSTFYSNIPRMTTVEELRVLRASTLEAKGWAGRPLDPRVRRGVVSWTVQAIVEAAIVEDARFTGSKMARWAAANHDQIYRELVPVFTALGGEAVITDLLRELGWSYNKLWKRLDRLIAAGYVGRVGRGRKAVYRLLGETS